MPDTWRSIVDRGRGRGRCRATVKVRVKVRVGARVRVRIRVRVRVKVKGGVVSKESVKEWHGNSHFTCAILLWCTFSTPLSIVSDPRA